MAARARRTKTAKARHGPQVHLFDSHVYIFRAYYSISGMETPDGTPISAAYGFANTLLKYVSETQPTHAACIFDHAQTSFRNAIEPGYKAGRTEAPEDLEPQFSICEEVARALGFACFSVENFEADDCIATLTGQIVAKGGTVRIVTTDKDLAQLVREDGKVCLHDLARDITRDADGVRERFGVSPHQIPDFLGLVGDTVDNLPGVPGVGAKTASAVLRAFESIDGIPADPESFSELGIRGAARAAALIDEHRERALRTRELASVVRDVPGLRAGLRDLRYLGARRDVVESLFARLGWERIATRVSRWAP